MNQCIANGRQATSDAVGVSANGYQPSTHKPAVHQPTGRNPVSCASFRSVQVQGGNQFELSHPQTKRLVVLQIDPALQIEVVNGQQEPTPLGWYSPGSCQKQPTGVFRAYLSLDGEKRVEVQSQISIQP